MSDYLTGESWQCGDGGENRHIIWESTKRFPVMTEAESFVSFQPSSFSLKSFFFSLVFILLLIPHEKFTTTLCNSPSPPILSIQYYYHEYCYCYYYFTPLFRVHIRVSRYSTCYGEQDEGGEGSSCHLAIDGESSPVDQNRNNAKGGRSKHTPTKQADGDLNPK